MPPTIHIDLDAFYAQVETVRLQLDPLLPLGVQQWSSLIAINYPARAKGITRHMTVKEAKEKCPELKCVHVATYDEHGTSHAYAEEPNVENYKVSLEPYRRASTKIFQILQREIDNAGGGILQKASIDEAYIDMSIAVQKKIDQSYTEAEPIWGDVAFMIGGEPADEGPKDPEEVGLFFTAQFAKIMRDRIYSELGYTSSAGIANNKTLAKICSSMHKPNKQSILTPARALNFLKDLPFTKIKSLGGKFGDRVETVVQCEKVGDIWKFSKDELCNMLSESEGTWLYQIVRGECHEEVSARTMTKSMMAAKAFRPLVTDLAGLEKWFKILSTEIYNRLQDDWALYKRWPKSFKISYIVPSQTPRSKHAAFPSRPNITSREPIAALAQYMFRSESAKEKLFPLMNLALGVERFEEQHESQGEISTMFKSIQSKTPDASYSGPGPVHNKTLEKSKIPPRAPFFKVNPESSIPTETPSDDLVSEPQEPVPAATAKKPFFSRDPVPQQGPIPEVSLDIEDPLVEISLYYKCAQRACHFELKMPTTQSAIDDLEAKKLEHEDWHFAVGISRERESSSSSRPGLPAKKRKPNGMAHKNTATKTLTLGNWFKKE